MRDHTSHTVVSRHEAVGALMQVWKFERRVETVPLSEALGRVLAMDVRSLNTLPNKLTSAMDGIAFYFADFENGVSDTTAWKRGAHWQFCNTGIGMPDDFDTALPIECVEIDDDEKVKILKTPEHQGQFTVAIGSNMAEGDLLASAGEILTPVLLSLITMGGVTDVLVIAKPRVAFIPTGSELVDAGERLSSGKNVESNAIMVCGKLTQWGAEPLRYPIIPDEWEIISKTLHEAAREADIVIINAGSSKGSDDFTCEILEKQGVVLNHELDQGPGRHTSYSLLEDTPVVGISGPPIGAEFTTDWFVKPLVDLYLGLSLEYPPIICARVSEDLPFQPRGVNVICRAFVSRQYDGTFSVRPLHGMGHPSLKACNEANAFITVSKDSHGFRTGDIIDVELRYPYLLPQTFIGE